MSRSDFDLESRLSTVLDWDPVALTELEGGMIGTVTRADLAGGRTVVAKTGDTPLSVEACMLEALARRSELPVPAVYHAEDDLLVLEHVEGSTDHGSGVAEDAAERLAALHDRAAEAFGFPFDTLTGPVRQPNPWTDSWPAFYREHRLLHVAELARAGGSLADGLYRRVETLATDLEELLRRPDGTIPEPALIHGDVWRTNVLSRDGRVTAFLDPATYYADPEIELAYIDWTDTFGEAFFDRYREIGSIADGFFERRRYVYRLYPILVHVHLFGGRYPEELDRTLSKLEY